MQVADIDIGKLVADRAAFDAFVYTPLEDAATELRRRAASPAGRAIRTLPGRFEEGTKAVLWRNVVTPNHDVSGFLSVAGKLDLEPLFFEYHEDRFDTRNECKFHLGKLYFCRRTGKNSSLRLDRVDVIDFNASNGRKLSSVRTVWDQSLVEFHHEWFLATFPNYRSAMYDGSDWLKAQGPTAQSYYAPFLSLFVRHGILIENFMLQGKELDFTRAVFLPAFVEVIKATGLKPLIVPIEPTDTEGDKYWLCYPHETAEFVTNRLKMTKSEAGQSLDNS